MSPALDPVEAVRQALEQSELLRAIAAARERHAQTAGYRALTEAEIAQLQRQLNAAADWSQVLVAVNFRPSKVVGCYFSGPARLGVFEHDVEIEPGLKLGSGLYHADLNDVTIGDHALILNVGLLAHAVIGPGALVKGCGTVAATGVTSFGNGQILPLAIETGGRETGIYAELTVDVAAEIAARRGEREMQAAYAQAVADYASKARSELLIVEAGARIKDTPKVLDVYVGPGAAVDAAQGVEHSTLLSLPDEPTAVRNGAYVKDSLLQWGVEVDTMGIVQRSVLGEHTHVERNGKVVDCVLGPNSGVAAGEFSASLIGPFVGMHHQSLLIATYWPGGRGNIAYGANVGSNHTAKLPDQELWVGEGVFFGLGVNIKFPGDYSRSPYTVIASGVTALPQRLAMPFALVNTPAETIPGVSPAFNELIPGWVLGENAYQLWRSERKFRTRNKARRCVLAFEVLRAETVEMLVDARTRLRAAEGRARLTDAQGQAVYTDREVEGLGKNYMLEPARKAGIESYGFFIGYYALRELKRRLDAGASAHGLLELSSADAVWEHARKLLAEEHPGLSVPDLLERLAEAQQRIARDTQASKEKDDARGARIVPGYAEAHSPAAEDPVVKEQHARAAQVKREVEAWVKSKRRTVKREP